ncbi:hypothetical protein PV08_03746 [Exophiala spinifera]|uniref:SnoaL-like domain-containing protein n=1 Tax=Exophiala spinifera TaxID=91928 RepID=A0A0D2BC72_9EURO|nr:uncharacterized protein PV08_03746 [Exophiala spinifera]KIW16558.1 hypothetical protein PV08_03746 [Exophiala spinifera]
MTSGKAIHSESNHYIAQRQQGFASAFQSCDVDGLMNYMSDSIDFCDYASNDLHLDKGQVRNFFARALGSSKDISIKTLSISGDKHFSTWEWALRFSLKSTGAEVRLLGISASWWDQDGKQIVRNHDYALAVGEFEWEMKNESGA